MKLTIDEIEIVDLVGNKLDWGVKSINAHKVWSKTKGEGVSIAVIDTGVNINHPDLKDRIKSQYNMIDKNQDVTDMNGHGTHVAGLLVGKKTGVAPMADLHVIKVLDENGKGAIVNILDGITHAMNLGVDVLSISLGGMYDIPLILKQRIIQAIESGVAIVSATGNNGKSEAFYPARMNEVISVGGYDNKLQLTEFTNMGYDVLAPSVKVLSTWKDCNYARMSGTSAANPLVAGGIALLISYYRQQGRELTPFEIKDILQDETLNFDLSKLIG